MPRPWLLRPIAPGAEKPVRGGAPQFGALPGRWNAPGSTLLTTMPGVAVAAPFLSPRGGWRGRPLPKRGRSPRLASLSAVPRTLALAKSDPLLFSKTDPGVFSGSTGQEFRFRKGKPMADRLYESGGPRANQRITEVAGVLQRQGSSRQAREQEPSDQRHCLLNPA
jgi:hypothetical protein